MKLLGDVIYYVLGWGLGTGIIVGISVLVLMPYL
jgi:hypothetical protein